MRRRTVGPESAEHPLIAPCAPQCVSKFLESSAYRRAQDLVPQHDQVGVTRLPPHLPHIFAQRQVLIRRWVIRMSEVPLQGVSVSY